MDTESMPTSSLLRTRIPFRARTGHWEHSFLSLSGLDKSPGRHRISSNQNDPVGIFPFVEGRGHEAHLSSKMWSLYGGIIYLFLGLTPVLSDAPFVAQPFSLTSKSIRGRYGVSPGPIWGRSMYTYDIAIQLHGD